METIKLNPDLLYWLREIIRDAQECLEEDKITFSLITSLKNLKEKIEEEQ